MQQSSTFKVYNASAGSGKTFTLVKEYLKVLLSTPDPNYFKYILAVTFTNKAAAEMKERVISNLHNFSRREILHKKTDMFLMLEEELSISDKILHERAIKILKNILDNYAAFNITTIDSFTYRLVRSFALDLGLSTSFDVDMDTKTLLNETVDALLTKIGEEEDLTKILIEFSLDKANEDRSWDISRELKDFAQLLLNENDRIYVYNIGDRSIEEFLELKNKLIKKLNILQKELHKIGEEGLQIISNVGLDHKDFYRTMLPGHFQNLATNIEKAKFFDQNTLKQKISENTFYSKSKSQDIKNSIDSISGHLTELYDMSERLYQLYSLNKLLLSSLVPLAVLSSINKVLDKLKDEKNIRLNAEFNQLISKNLQEQPIAFIYERIGEKFKHYFIDEMQDTSQLQWQNLIPLVNNALSQEGTSLLLVGDTKQSIYRWRGSQPEQFSKLSVKGNTKSHNPFFIPKDIIPLATNYRSYHEIINFNNQFFQHIAGFFNKEEYASIYAEENQQKFNEKEGGFVEVSFIDNNLIGEEKELAYSTKVLDIIKRVESQFNLDEVCILTRTGKQGVSIANYLSKSGIDIISSETLLLQNSEKVTFIIDVLSYLQNNANKEAKFNILYFLYHHFRIEKDKHDFIKKNIDDSRNLFMALKEFPIVFDEKLFYKMSLYESVEYIIRSFSLNFSADAYLKFFLDEVLNFSIKSISDISSFLDYWDQKKDTLSIVVPEKKDAVRIMTIHKSKGLEFPVVIYPFDLDIYGERNPKVWYPLFDDKEFKGFENLLVNCNKTLKMTGETGKLLFENHKNELELDNFNLLYVAFTRAVEQLYIIGEDKKKSDSPRYSSQFLKNYLKTKNIWKEGQLIYTFGNSNRISLIPEFSKSNIELSSLTSTSWQEHDITIAPVSSVLWDTETEVAITYGNLVHEILSQIKTKNDIEDTIEKYVLQGYINEKETKIIKSLIISIVEHPSLKNYYQQNLIVYNEREIITNEGEILIPDRLVINENNEAVIIDYKTGKPENKYHQQLNKYANVVGQLGFNVVKKILVYTSESILIEEV